MGKYQFLVWLGLRKDGSGRYSAVANAAWVDIQRGRSVRVVKETAAGPVLVTIQPLATP